MEGSDGSGPVVVHHEHHVSHAHHDHHAHHAHHGGKDGMSYSHEETITHTGNGGHHGEGHMMVRHHVVHRVEPQRQRFVPPPPPPDDDMRLLDEPQVESLQPKIVLGGLLAIFAQVYLWGNVFVTLFKPNRPPPPGEFKDIPPPDSSPFESVLLDPEAITAVQCDRPPSVQAMLEQEAQKLGSDPVLSEPIFGKSSNEPLLKSLHAFDGAAENEEPRRIFREIFAGKAGLSQAVAGFGVVDVAEPFDFKHGKHHRDILDDTVYEQLLVDAQVFLARYGISDCLVGPSRSYSIQIRVQEGLAYPK
eukprot:symbB.v1.2.034791.t1/scaffold4555.1/size38081/1